MRWGQFRLRDAVHLISRLAATASPHRGSLGVRTSKASPSRGGGSAERRDGEVVSNLQQPLSLLRRQHPYPFCPFGTFPPDRGNRPLKGEPLRCAPTGSPARRQHPSEFQLHLLLTAIVLRQLAANPIPPYQAARSRNS